MRKNSLKKVSISIVAVLVMTIMLPLMTSADYSEDNLTPNSITINVKDADVRDVLSAIAKNMGYSIIYKGSATTITIKLEDMAPTTAFDYILKNIGVTYLKDGDVLIVASREVLKQDYARSLYLTKFDLTYIDAGTLNSKISQLGIPVTVVSMEANKSSIWVQGFPSDVTKVRELINVLDISENSTIAADGSSDTVANTKTLSYIKLNFIQAHTFNRFLKTLGINVGMVLSPDSQILHLYATPSERQEVASICAQVDNMGSFANVGNANMFEYCALTNVPKDIAISTINSVCSDVEIITVDNATKGFYLKGNLEAIRSAREVLQQLEGNDKLSTPENTFFTYSLKNITAAEAENRLAGIKLDESVSYYPSAYSEFSKTLYVYCNKDYEQTMRDVLDKIDATEIDTYNAPIYMAATEEEADIMIEYLETMLGISSGVIEWKKFQTGSGCVLYIENADVETIQKVEALMERLKNLKNSYITPGLSI